MLHNIVFNLKSLQGLFFENGTFKQTIFKNTFWLTLGTGVSKVLNFVLLIYVARILGATEYGEFSFALAFVSLFTVVADLGISTILVREFAREKSKNSEFYAIISLKIVLSVLMILLALVGSLLITQDIFIRKIIFILSLFAFVNTFIDLFYAVFQARQKMEYQAGAAILGSVLLTVFSFFVLFKTPSAENLSYAYFLSGFMCLFLMILFFQFKVMPLKIIWQKSVWKKFLMISWPLAFTALFGLLYTYIDSVMLGYFGQMKETGWYNAAYRIAWMGYIFTGLAVTSFYPVLSRYFEESKEKLQHAWNCQMDLMMALSFPLMAGGAILSGRIIEFAYGAEFAASIPALQILLAMVGILLLYAPLYQILIVADRQKKIFWTTAFGAAINVALNWVLIPRYSLYGAAFATVVAQFSILLMLAFFAFKHTSIRIDYLRYMVVLAGVTFSTAVMVFALSSSAVYYLPVFLSIPAGILVYFFVLFGLKYIVERLGFVGQDLKLFYKQV